MQVILFTKWYFGHTGRSFFQTYQSTTQNGHLIQDDVKFQWSVFIFLNKAFHAFVLTKFPLSLFNNSSCSYLIPPYQFLTIPSLFYHNTYFSWREFWGCNQSKWLWHSLVCLVAPEDDQLPLMCSCWCSIDLLMIFFLVSPLYTNSH